MQLEVFEDVIRIRPPNLQVSLSFLEKPRYFPPTNSRMYRCNATNISFTHILRTQLLREIAASPLLHYADRTSISVTISPMFLIGEVDMG